ncbi:hypothetical protein, partial [Agrobacterium sp.]|uniref:hypothetical protein n=1 Tax=Agrobacterium sp. TaxID=361 RepID=UPI0025BD5418
MISVAVWVPPLTRSSVSAGGRRQLADEGRHPVSSSGGRLDGQAFEIGGRIFRVEDLAVEEGFL